MLNKDPLDTVIEVSDLAGKKKVASYRGKTFREALELDKDVVKNLLKPGNKALVSERTLEAAMKLI